MLAIIYFPITKQLCAEPGGRGEGHVSGTRGTLTCVSALRAGNTWFPRHRFAACFSLLAAASQRIFTSSCTSFSGGISQGQRLVSHPLLSQSVSSTRSPTHVPTLPLLLGPLWTPFVSSGFSPAVTSPPRVLTSPAWLPTVTCLHASIGDI